MHPDQNTYQEGMTYITNTSISRPYIKTPYSLRTYIKNIYPEHILRTPYNIYQDRYREYISRSDIKNPYISRTYIEHISRAFPVLILVYQEHIWELITYIKNICQENLLRAYIENSYRYHTGKYPSRKYIKNIHQEHASKTYNIYQDQISRTYIKSPYREHIYIKSIYQDNMSRTYITNIYHTENIHQEHVSRTNITNL